jgi:FkbM family methyltransferase
MTELSTALGLRLRRFLAKSTSEKFESLSYRLRALLPTRPQTIQLPFGVRWQPLDSALDHQLMAGTFENAEANFVARFLGPGMTVLDVGAHHGFYTLVASTRVGASGTVVAFEPSPRERKRLERHLRLNHCQNVRVVPMALGLGPGRAQLHLVEGAEDYCNSLRPPVVASRTRPVPVEVTSLDAFLAKARIARVHLVKLDIEGAELDALKGATKLLGTQPRPLLMVEAYDLRTRPWGYAASEIVRLLDTLSYQCCELLDGGIARPIDAHRTTYDANLVAVPLEKLADFLNHQGAQ